MPSINMLTSAHKVKGQGVLSACEEQINLVKKGMGDRYDIHINKFKLSEVVHYHTIDFKFFLSMPFAKIKGETVAYVHFIPETIEGSIKLPYFIRKIFYKYIIWFYKAADHLVVVNPYFIEKLKAYGIPESKITYIPNYVSIDKFYRYDEAKILTSKESMGFHKDKFTVLGVGQVQTRKGVLDFIDIAKKCPDIQFVWAGGFSFGAITDGYKELKKVVENPPQNVKFIGIVDREKMNDVFNAADMFFLPSFQELFPMCILEAMNLGLPILLRDIDIYKNILFDYYLRGNNVEEFVTIINKLKNDKEYYEEAGKLSWKGHEFYSEDHVLQMWKDFYTSITKKGDKENAKIVS